MSNDIEWLDANKKVHHYNNALELKIHCLKAELKACVEGNEYYANKCSMLQDRINKVLDILMEEVK
jgi:hypothetical protein